MYIKKQLKKQTITTDCFCATVEREGAIFNSHGDFVVELGVYVDYGLVLILPDYEFGLCMVRISGKLFATYGMD